MKYLVLQDQIPSLFSYENKIAHAVLWQCKYNIHCNSFAWCSFTSVLSCRLYAELQNNWSDFYQIDRNAALKTLPARIQSLMKTKRLEDLFHAHFLWKGSCPYYWSYSFWFSQHVSFHCMLVLWLFQEEGVFKLKEFKLCLLGLDGNLHELCQEKK